MTTALTNLLEQKDNLIVGYIQDELTERIKTLNENLSKAYKETLTPIEERLAKIEKTLEKPSQIKQKQPLKRKDEQSQLDDHKEKIQDEDKGLTPQELANRLGYASASSLNSKRLPKEVREGEITFAEWSKSKDPDGIGSRDGRRSGLWRRGRH